MKILKKTTKYSYRNYRALLRAALNKCYKIIWEQMLGYVFFLVKKLCKNVLCIEKI